MIRARLGILLAAVIVFAPGVGFGDGSAQSPSDVAARMLAPTFDAPDVAAYNSTVSAKKAQDRDRRLFNGVVALTVLLGAVFFTGSWFIGPFGKDARRHRLFVSSHRDRGPPHLQLT